MKGFRRAQLRGSDELFRTTDNEPATEQKALAVEVPEAVHPVPSAPDPDRRTVRLSADEIELLADAVQHLKFPHQAGSRPSMERFERLEEVRQKLLESL